jgi:hypothetical protein
MNLRVLFTRYGVNILNPREVNVYGGSAVVIRSKSFTVPILDRIKGISIYLHYYVYILIGINTYIQSLESKFGGAYEMKYILANTVNNYCMLNSRL